MLRIRMQRAGKTHQPYYRIVAAHGTRPRDGAFVDKIGTYHPLTHPPKLHVDETKALKWLNNGAKPTDTVKNLFRRLGILHRWRLTAKGLSPEEVQAELDAWKQRQAARATEKRAKKTKALKKKAEPPAVETPASE